MNRREAIKTIAGAIAAIGTIGIARGDDGVTNVRDVYVDRPVRNGEIKLTFPDRPVIPNYMRRVEK